MLKRDLEHSIRPTLSPKINRKIATAVADLHFAPTERSRVNLLKEGVSPSSIFVTGNTVIDALRLVANLQHPGEVVDPSPENSRVVLVTAHRRENFGVPLENICRAILRLCEIYPRDVHFAFPRAPKSKCW